MLRWWRCARLGRRLGIIGSTAGALVHARLDRVVYATADPKAGAAGSVLSVINHPRLNHQMQLDSGLLAEESSELLRAFFRERR
jgi:tRNA(adenine34) deaminase